MTEQLLTRTLLEAAMRKGIAAHPELHKKWIEVQYRFGALAGHATLLSFAMNTRVDMLLRTLEAENLERSTSDMEPDVDLAGDLFLSLSESWVTRCYELVRVARERITARGDATPERLAHLLYQLELVRMPIDKGEIAKAIYHKGEPLVLTREDGSEPQPYTKGSFIVQRGLCGQSGAAMWWPIDLRTQQTVEVCRRDLSDWLVGLFD
ncbi:hypothetical protein [Paradevosia shaoguanensis]|uniref:hypothetical protein n=1 Tax=Paradevosia shaoguanensis TaxID=1335043 RepID=UPI00193160C4|nr:hypothetical protein [Paradevosia shaoguanensis]